MGETPSPDIFIAAVTTPEPDLMAVLADLGATSVDLFGGPDRQTEKAVAAARRAGLTVILRWPDWRRLNLCGAEYAFQAYDGRTNATEHSRVEGPSLWHPEAEERCAEQIGAVAEMGVDGVLIGSLMSDRPYPTDWYPFGDEAVRGTTMFWSWDEHAKRAWREVCDGEPMPEYALCNDGLLGHGLRAFYDWYQEAWLLRITQLSIMALDAGLEDIRTWYLPMTHYAIDTVANATADNVLVMQRWRQAIKSRDGRPTAVVANLFGLETHWPAWYDQGVATMTRVGRCGLGWDCCVGMQSCDSAETAIPNIQRNAVLAAELGFTGIFADGQFISQPELRGKATAVLTNVQALAWRNT